MKDERGRETAKNAKGEDGGSRMDQRMKDEAEREKQQAIVG
jgi:hypothetical protein